MAPPGVADRLGALGGPIHDGRRLARGRRSASVSFATGGATTASTAGGAEVCVAGLFVDMSVMKLRAVDNGVGRLRESVDCLRRYWSSGNAGEVEQVQCE